MADREAINRRKRELYAANPDAAKRRAARRRASDPEAAKARDRLYYQQNKDAVRTRNKAWDGANPDRCRAAKSAWEKRNPEYMRAKAAARRVPRGSREKVPLNIRAILLGEQGGLCVYCKTDISESSHIDHIMPVKLGGAHIRANLQLLCPSCNLRKKDKHPADFEREIG